MCVSGVSSSAANVRQAPKITTPTTTPTPAPQQPKVSAGTDADGDHDGSTGPDPGEHSLNVTA
jgi:hypothetical protein